MRSDMYELIIERPRRGAGWRRGGRRRLFGWWLKNSGGLGPLEY